MIFVLFWDPDRIWILLNFSDPGRIVKFQYPHNQTQAALFARGCCVIDGC